MNKEFNKKYEINFGLWKFLYFFLKIVVFEPNTQTQKPKLRLRSKTHLPGEF